MDLVTFFHSPEGQNQEALLQASPRLFDPRATKADYSVDAYVVQLNGSAPEALVAQFTYWNSPWSHRRDGYWKGYTRVDLAPVDDPAAKTGTYCVNKRP